MSTEVDSTTMYCYCSHSSIIHPWYAGAQPYSCLLALLTVNYNGLPLYFPLQPHFYDFITGYAITFCSTSHFLTVFVFSQTPSPMCLFTVVKVKRIRFH